MSLPLLPWDPFVPETTCATCADAQCLRVANPKPETSLDQEQAPARAVPLVPHRSIHTSGHAEGHRGFIASIANFNSDGIPVSPRLALLTWTFPFRRVAFSLLLFPFFFFAPVLSFLCVLPPPRLNQASADLHWTSVPSEPDPLVSSLWLVSSCSLFWPVSRSRRNRYLAATPPSIQTTVNRPRSEMI